MDENFLRRLRTGHEAMDRMQAWGELRVQPEVTHGWIAHEDLQQLWVVLQQEANPQVRIDATLQLVCLSTKPTSDGEPALPENSLLRWLWEPFKQPAGLFYVADSMFAHRDVAAMNNLSRRLHFDTYNATAVHPVPLNDSTAVNKTQTDRSYKSTCLVGRLSMFGKVVEGTLKPQNSRYSFPNNKRPEGLAAGQIDPSYHRIREQIDGENWVDYVVEEKDGLRTDYGLLLRYPANTGPYTTTVVLCAGCSSFGTLGAALWGARYLGDAQNPSTGEPICVAPHIGPESCMEAFIRVTFKSDSSDWTPTEVTLCRLFIDDYEWSRADRAWHKTKPNILRLQLRDGKPIAIYVNDEDLKFRLGTQAFRLAVAVIQGIHESPTSSVSIETLAKNSTIWKKPFDEAEARRRLSTLNDRQLKGLLVIHDEVSLNAKIVF